MCPPASACQTMALLRAIPKRHVPCVVAGGEAWPGARPSQDATARRLIPARRQKPCVAQLACVGGRVGGRLDGKASPEHVIAG